MRRLCRLLPAFVAVLALIFCAALPRAARADDFAIPGLDSDSGTYAEALRARHPAGGSPVAQAQAEQRAAAATAGQNWAAAAAAWEERIALGNATAAEWLALAQAQLRRTPPDNRHALEAAWQAFSATDTGPDQIPALLAMAAALDAEANPVQEQAALSAALERAPDDARLRQLLADARRAAGLLVARVGTEPDADPPRACIAFSVPPVRSGDFRAQDWVMLDPPVPAAAVTREGDQICVSGLPSGATTRITLRAGLPGEDGLALQKPTTLAVAMGDRAARIAFDTRLYLLPRGQAPAVTLTTVNISSVKLTLARLTERNIVAFIRDQAQLGEPVGPWQARQISDQLGKTVWQGAADITGFQRNRSVHTALPLPEALSSAGPGVYALLATPGDGTPEDDAASSVQMIVRTDLAPTVWRGSDGLTVQVRGYSDAAPRAGVRLQLLAQSNDILGEATTDADGIARFPAPLLHGDGAQAPREIHAFGPGDDFTALDLDRPSFDLTDRGVTGQPHPGPLDAFVWLDRGIYRPGETVQVMALLRDAAGQPADIPATLIVRRPNGQVFLQTVPARGADASIHLPVGLSRGAAVGTWTVELRADPALPPIGQAEFRVDAFVPDRMAVDLGPAPGAIVPGQDYSLPVAARFLYGAPAANLSGKATVRIVIDDAPFPALAGYRIGLDGEAYAPDASPTDIPDTDADGHTSVPIALTAAPDITHALKATVDVSIDDPSGHAAHAETDIPIRPAGPLIGIKPLFPDDAVDAGTEAGFDIAAVDPDGHPVALAGRLRLVREVPDWRLVVKGRYASYELSWKDEPLETAEVAIPQGAPLHWAKTLPFGRYRLEVAQSGGLAATSVRFRSGWVSSDNPDVPDKVDVSTADRTYRPGQSARIHIAAPFAGPATLLVLTDRVHAVRTLDVPAGGTDIDVPVSADWGPGAYVAVHVFRPAQVAAQTGAQVGAQGAAHAGSPQRAIGLVWVGLDPAARTLPVSFDTRPEYLPRQRITVPVHAAPGAWVTLAAVDEGILRLTDFAAPDPAGHFLGRRRLGLDIRDDWGRLIPPAEGAATLLRQGGDEGGAGLSEIPQKIVSLFVAPVQAGADGVAQVAIGMPDFAGQVRLMAVAWSGNRIGAAHADILIRDPLVAEPLLPRFLAPGDDARLAVLMQNVALPPGEASVDITVDGPLALGGPAHLAATLAGGAQATPVTVLHATGVGRGVVHLAVNGPGGFHVDREAAILVRPARGPVSLVAGGELAAGAEAQLSVPADRFLPGSWRAEATFGAPVRYDVGALLDALASYPMSCLEQSISRAFPLAFAPAPSAAQRAALGEAVASVLDRQRYDGGFALWSAGGDAEPWLSAYATEFLLRAAQAGAPVADQPLHDALKYLADSAASEPGKPEEFAAQAYRLYVLALAGQGRPGAARILAQNFEQLPTPLARAQLGAALALAHERGLAEAAFRAALAFPARKPWGADYGTALRDQAAIVLLLTQTGMLPDRLPGLQAQLPGPDLDPQRISTQEQAWLAATGLALGRNAHPVSVALNGAALPTAPVVRAALSGPAVARNLGANAVMQTVATTGLPAAALPAAASHMKVSRQFFALDGSALNLDALRQNTVFVLLIEGRADDGQDHQAMIMHGLPAGWEIAARLPAGAVPGLSWLGELSATQAQPAYDDRYAAVVDLSADHPGFRVAVELRAVTPGSFELPGAELSDMYRPALFAQQNTGRIVVQPAE